MVRFSEATRWNPGSFRSAEWGWPAEVIRPFRDAIVPSVVPVRTADYPDGHPPLVTIRFDGSMERRDADPADIKGRLFLARAGDLVYSKIDVRNGAIGIVPPTLPVVAVTAEYPVHDVREDVADVSYVRLLVRCSGLRREIQSRVSGASGRKRIMPADLLDMQAPFPSLAEQRAIVGYAEAAEAASRLAQADAAKRRRKADAAFLAALGLALPEEHERTKVQTRRWSALERWGVAYNQRTAGAGVGADESRFPIVELGSVVADLENGWSPKCFPRPAEPDEWGVLKLGAVSFGTYNDAENKALPPNLAPVPRLEVKAGDVLISRANIPRLVGACTLVASTRPRLMLCDKIFRVVPMSPEPVDPAFLAEVLKIPMVRLQIEASCTGTSPTMQNITKPSLLRLRFPLPPLELQRTFVAALTEARVAAEAVLGESTSRLATALAEVDAMILGTRPIPSIQE